MTKPYRILATRSAASIAGYAQAVLKSGGEVLKFATYEEAQEYADYVQKECCSPHLRYQPIEASKVRGVR